MTAKKKNNKVNKLSLNTVSIESILIANRLKPLGKFSCHNSIS